MIKKEEIWGEKWGREGKNMDFHNVEISTNVDFPKL